MEKSQNALVRGRQLCTQFWIFDANFPLGFAPQKRPPTSHQNLGKMRGKQCILETCGGPFFGEPTQVEKLPIFEGSLKSRRIASFLMLSTSKIEEASQNCFDFEVVKFKN